MNSLINFLKTKKKKCKKMKNMIDINNLAL